MEREGRAAAPGRGPVVAGVPERAALLADLGCVLVFAAAGRLSHGEGLAGTWGTAWPFLVGTGLGWTAVVALRRRRPVAPGTALAGLVVLAGAVVPGMVIRGASGSGGTPLPFVVTTTVFLGVLLLGWRGVAGLVARRR